MDGIEEILQYTKEPEAFYWPKIPFQYLMIESPLFHYIIYIFFH